MALTRLLLTLGGALMLSALVLAVFSARAEGQAVLVRFVALAEGVFGFLLVLSGILRWIRGTPGSRK